MKMITTTKSNLCFFGELEKKRKKTKWRPPPPPPHRLELKKPKFEKKGRRKIPRKNIEKTKEKYRIPGNQLISASHSVPSSSGTDFTGFYWVSNQFCRVLPSFVGHEWVSRGWTEWERVLPGFYDFKIGSTRFYLVLPSFTGFFWIANGFYRVLPGLSSITNFSLVPKGFT